MLCVNWFAAERVDREMAMSARKERLRSLLGGQETELAPSAQGVTSQGVSPGPAETPKRSSSAAVKAMGLSLGALSQEADEARRLRQTLAAGEQVVEIDPASIEPSPFADRLSKAQTDDPEFEALTASIASHGQQVPVLLRPHQDEAKAARGLYQIAYGHRRVEAARALGRPVRAVVRTLDDAALALAQGKENAERRALSFIERALFARTLLEHGFERATVQAALAVHKSEMSRLLQVAEAVPHNIVRAIGPAPRAGRPRWLALAELIAADRAGLAGDELASPDFRAADSDARFQRLFDRLRASARSRQPQRQDRARKIAGQGGQAIAEFSRTGRNASLTIPASAGEGFADYVAERLPALHDAFMQGEGREEGGKAQERGGQGAEK